MVQLPEVILFVICAIGIGLRIRRLRRAHRAAHRLLPGDPEALGILIERDTRSAWAGIAMKAMIIAAALGQDAVEGWCAQADGVTCQLCGVVQADAAVWALLAVALWLDTQDALGVLDDRRLHRALEQGRGEQGAQRW